jgi:hypothetical protein
MAKTNQVWYNGKGAMSHYGDFCSSRNHQLISLSGLEDGSGKIAKGSISFFCNTCQSQVTTSVASYCASKVTSQSKGCKVCKTNLAILREKEKIAAMKEAPSVKNRRRRRKWKKSTPYKSREAIRQHLLSETNPHNTFVLELMDIKESIPCNPPERSKTTDSNFDFDDLTSNLLGEAVKREVDDCHVITQIHHIIPCHDGGEERVYNEIRVTLYEHWKIHLLRFEAYGQYGDAYIFNFCWSQLPQ